MGTGCKSKVKGEGGEEGREEKGGKARHNEKGDMSRQLDVSWEEGGKFFVHRC